MANFAQINITFSGFSELNAIIRIQFQKVGVAVYERNWVCKAIRTGPFEYTQGVNAADQYNKFLQATYADIIVDPDLQNWNVSPYNITPNTVAFQADQFGWYPLFTAFLLVPRASSTFIYEVLGDPATLYVYNSITGWVRVNDEPPFGLTTPLSVYFNGLPNTVKLYDWVYADGWKMIS